MAGAGDSIHTAGHACRLRLYSEVRMVHIVKDFDSKKKAGEKEEDDEKVTEMKK